MKIGNVEIKGKIVLAPMAGVSDSAYRRICMEMGAAYTVTEMVSARALDHQDKKSDILADLGHDLRPASIQLFGDDPLVMARGADKIMKHNPDMIDVNMGCPMPKIVGNGSGSALMKNPSLCGEIVREMVRAATVPITVKIRAGWDENSINAVEIAKICEANGAYAITVHARTRAQMYSGHSRNEIIKAVKHAVSIPVIGNGDITGAQSASVMFDETNCDLVMVGRAALGNPWIFREINLYLNNECRIIPPAGTAERILTIRKHIGLACQLKGERIAIREARKHAAWYFKGIRGAAALRKEAVTITSMDDLDRLLEKAYIQYMAERDESI